MTISSRLGWMLDQTFPRQAPDNETPQEPPRSDVIMDRRFGIRIPGRRYYLDIRIGRERRSPERLEQEGQRRLPLASLVYCAVGSAFFAAFGFLCFAYLLKSMAGINLFDRESMLHPLYMRIFG